MVRIHRLLLAEETRKRIKISAAIHLEALEYFYRSKILISCLLYCSCSSIILLAIDNIVHVFNKLEKIGFIIEYSCKYNVHIVFEFLILFSLFN